MLPILSCNTNLVGASAITVEAKHAVFDPRRVAPVDGCACAAGRRATASIFGAVCQTGAGLEDPGVCHGEESGEGGNCSTCDLHFGDLKFPKSRRSGCWGRLNR